MLGSRIAVTTEASHVRTANAAELPAAQRAKATNRPLCRHSRNTATGRRVRDLADAYALALGGWAELGDMLTANVLRAAELVALAEQARADALRNGNYDPLALSRLDGCANRALRSLNIGGQRKAEGPSLGDLLSADLARQAPAGAPPVAPDSPPAQAHHGPSYGDGGASYCVAQAMGGPRCVGRCEVPRDCSGTPDPIGGDGTVTGGGRDG